MRFNALSSPSSTLLPPLFFFLLSSPSSAAHHFPLLTARPPAPSSLVAHAYHIPPLTARPHEEKLLRSPARIHFPAGSQAPKTPMAEPTDTQSRDWNSLPDVLLEQICSHMDLLSTVRLAACSVSLYRLLVCNQPALLKTPCLLMPDPRRWPRHRLDDPTEVAVVPLDMLPLPVHLSFMRGHYWAGMKANWTVLIHHSGSPWHLVDIYTQ